MSALAGWDRLPLPLVRLSLSYADPKAWSRARAVCTVWSAVVLSESDWERAFLLEFDPGDASLAALGKALSASGRFRQRVLVERAWRRGKISFTACQVPMLKWPARFSSAAQQFVTPSGYVVSTAEPTRRPFRIVGAHVFAGSAGPLYAAFDRRRVSVVDRIRKSVRRFLPPAAVDWRRLVLPLNGPQVDADADRDLVGPSARCCLFAAAASYAPVADWDSRS